MIYHSGMKDQETEGLFLFSHWQVDIFVSMTLLWFGMVVQIKTQKVQGGTRGFYQSSYKVFWCFFQNLTYSSDECPAG